MIHRSVAAVVVSAALVLAGGSAAAIAQPRPPPPGPGQPPPPNQPPVLPPPQPVTPVRPTPTATASIGTDAVQTGAGLGLVLIVAVGAAVVVAGGTLASIRALRRRPRGSSLGPVTAPTGASPASFEELLEVSRRLTSATTSGDIERAVVREAVGLVHATGVALVRRIGEELVVAHQTQPDLLRADRIRDGVVERVADTGQPVVEVSATEPAIRFLPVALIAVPLVGGGRVDGVLVLVRSAERPFTTAERDRLTSLAPIAAAAMQSARESDEQSSRDQLTGVGNRRRLDTDLLKVLAAASGRSTAVIMIDLDHFKAVNDEHGHPAGDALLRAIAEVLRTAVRPVDAVYRYGGEEFCIVLPDADTATAVTVAERVRAAIAAQPFDVGGGTLLAQTASLGAASATSGTPAELIARADAALYEAKHAGRDRVVAAR